MARSRTSNGTKDSSLGFEAKLWLAADKLRSNMDAAVPRVATSEPQAKAYKHAIQSNLTTRRRAVMNLALHGIETDFGPEHGDTFRRGFHHRADAGRERLDYYPRRWLADHLRHEHPALFRRLPAGYCTGAPLVAVRSAAPRDPAALRLSPRGTPARRLLSEGGSLP
jgi:hypothetical protein